MQMKRKILILILILAQCLSPQFVNAQSNNPLILSSTLKVSGSKPYRIGQNLTISFSLKNISQSPVKIETLMVFAKANDKVLPVNSKWQRDITLLPQKEYSYVGEILFSKPGRYELNVCYRSQEGSWRQDLTFDGGIQIQPVVEVQQIKNPFAQLSDKLPDAHVNKSYGPIQLKNLYNESNFTFSLESGVLPDGILLMKTGEISGIPKRIGNYQFKVKATSSEGKTYSSFFELNVVSSFLTLYGYIGSLSVTEKFDLKNLFYNGQYENGDIVVDNDPKVTIRSTDEKIAIIQNNVLQGIHAGNASIYAEISGTSIHSNYIPICISENKSISSKNNAVSFNDLDSHWALESISNLYGKSIINGYPDGNFYPDKNLNRAELSKLLCKSFYLSQNQESKKSLSDIDDHWAKGYIEKVKDDFTNITNVFDPDHPSNREEFTSAMVNALGWSAESVDPGILDLAFKDSSNISPQFRNTIAIALKKGLIKGLPGRIFGSDKNLTRAEDCKLIENAIKIGGNNLVDISSTNETAQKENPTPTKPPEKFYVPGLREKRLTEMFGKNSNGEPNYYKTKEQADKEMVTIPVNVWDINKSGQKFSKTVQITINSRISKDVIEIFDLIFKDPEKFPIHSMACYAWREPMSSGNLSEHNYGTCIDINPYENPQLINGKNISDGKWEPGVNPYSITTTCSVLKAFRTHQWTWGGSDWSGNNHDYMHFSFLGY